MLLETREVNEFHKNGRLEYQTRIGVVAPLFEGLYKNTFINNKGETLIRKGVTKRFWDNGQLNWTLEYNDDGSITREKSPSYRKDGSLIDF